VHTHDLGLPLNTRNQETSSRQSACIDIMIARSRACLSVPSHHRDEENTDQHK
ncbi:Uncharacterized protein DAT39_011181, partial [Clarias magur]